MAGRTEEGVCIDGGVSHCLREYARCEVSERIAWGETNWTREGSHAHNVISSGIVRDHVISM